MKRINAYERAINKMWEEILVVGSKVEELISLSMEGLTEQDKEKAHKVLDMEKEINEIEDKIEIRVLELISLQQPLTEELRKLLGILRIIDNLERAADNAVNIAEIAIELSDKGDYFKPLVDIPMMSRLTGEMMGSALTAYSNEDTELAKEVIKKDIEIDETFESLYAELISYMKEDSSYVEQASHLAFVARYLEKIGDHAVNIAEMVNFMVSGKKRC